MRIRAYAEHGINTYPQTYPEFAGVKGLLLAVARKQIEVSHYTDGISDAHRESLMKAADSMFVCAKGFYPASSQPAVQAAWDASLDSAALFGYRAVGVFEIRLSGKPCGNPTLRIAR